MPVRQVIGSGTVPVKVWARDLDESSYRQLKNISRLSIVHSHVAVMPDAHLGIGCTIGSVVPTLKAIIPAAVGVDIGCGMMAVKTNLNAVDLPDNLRSLREGIEQAVPLGPGKAHRNALEFSEHSELDSRFKDFSSRHAPIQKLYRKNDWVKQMGTLGGGNHFIEICLDENQNVWVMLHSGSRGVGNQLAQYFIQLARKDMQSYQINLPDRDLAYLREGTLYFDDYVAAVHWAQDYAKLNRASMMNLVMQVMVQHFPQCRAEELQVNCHHNYVAREHHFGKDVYVTRKGAIRADKGEMGIIPGSMGTRSYIVRGLGNAESFHSCSHGAGRRMSRKAALKNFTMEDLEQQTAGVELGRRQAILDEIPGAYKDIDQVMEDQSDLVEEVHRLKQVVCVKGD